MVTPGFPGLIVDIFIVCSQQRIFAELAASKRQETFNVTMTVVSY